MTELATVFTFIAARAPLSGRVVARKLDRRHHVHSRSQHAGAGAPPALWTHRRCIVLAASADDPAVVPLVGIATTEALACACGCSVFDVGGLNMLQEQDHGGEVF